MSQNPVMDQTDDVSRQELYRLSKLYDFPDYVKQASHSQLLSPDPKIPETGFADPRGKKYCCATKAATWLSYLFFLEKQATMHPKISGWIRQRLDGFSNYWGLSADVKRLEEKHAAVNRERLTDADYLMVWRSENGDTQRQYPIRNSGELKVAADWFAANRDHFVFSDRRTMAEKLLEKANKFATVFPESLEDLLEKQAGHGSFVPREVSQLLRQRLKVARADEQFRRPIEELADSIERSPQIASYPDKACKLASTIDSLDRALGLVSHYSPTLPRPEDVLFKISWKIARAALDDACHLTTGSVYSKAEFAKLALHDIRAAFGHQIAEEVSCGLMVDPEKMAEIATTLPRADAQLLDRVLSESGIFPMSKTATAVRRPNTEELQELAQLARNRQQFLRT